MDPNITIYNSYRKSLNTILGSFPVYNNIAAGCIAKKNVAVETALDLLALDEVANQFFLIQEFPGDSPLYDPFTDIGLLIDINSRSIRPDAYEEIYTYNLLI